MFKINQIENGKDYKLKFENLKFRKDGVVVLENINLNKAMFGDTSFYIIYPRFHFFNIKWSKEKKVYDEIAHGEETTNMERL